MKTVLLIEDNEAIRETTAELIELAGYHVQTAENGKTGVQKALQTKPDLVICDITMPVLDGYGVLHIFNKSPVLSDIPFIFLTAKSERNDFRKGMEMGADDYLTKPFNESELLSAIQGRLNRFEHIKPDHPPDNTGLSQLLDPTSQVRNLHDLSVDRRAHSVRKKQFVYSEGDEPNRIYFLKSGKVKTVRFSPDGKELVTGIYNAGSFFGYLAMLEEADYMDSAMTLEPSELVYIPKADFQQLLSTNVEVSGQFIKLLAERVDEREKQLLGMAYNSLRRRVADMLLKLHEEQPNGIIQLLRDDLAAMIGTATESLIRTLSEFRQNGLLEFTPTGGIRVLQPQKLRQASW